MIKALQSRANKKAIISNLDGYESEIVDRFLNRIKTNVKIKDECKNVYKAEYENGSGFECTYGDIYLNEWDRLETIEFKYIASSKNQYIDIHEFIDADVKIISPTTISHKLLVSGYADGKYAYLYKFIEFDIKVNNKYTVKLITKILMDKIARPNEFANLATEIRNINRVDLHAFIHSGFNIEGDIISTTIDDITLSTRYRCMDLMVNMRSALNQYYGKVKK